MARLTGHESSLEVPQASLLKWCYLAFVSVSGLGFPVWLGLLFSIVLVHSQL